ncbi:hypothetical protein [Acidocella sp.]|uniref:hypothetical protein n=1 Tax=Acidocella sp. TaxID=50710 RepID=UPI00260C4D2E|nr:hypothetical protein [Acidocella sp.]MDD2794629.1 hypothetical protein [Acidocella sp.]
MSGEYQGENEKVSTIFKGGWKTLDDGYDLKSIELGKGTTSGQFYFATWRRTEMEAGHDPEPFWRGPVKDLATAYEGATRGDSYIMDAKTKGELFREQAAVGAATLTFEQASAVWQERAQQDRANIPARTEEIAKELTAKHAGSPYWGDARIQEEARRVAGLEPSQNYQRAFNADHNVRMATDPQYRKEYNTAAEENRQAGVEAQSYWEKVASGASQARASGAVESQDLTRPPGRTR